jgi:hypothetical protein
VQSLFKPKNVVFELPNRLFVTFGYPLEVTRCQRKWIFIDGCCTAGADQLDPVEKGEWPPPQNSREATLRKEVSRLKRVLAEKTLELDFSKVRTPPKLAP